MKSSRHKQVSKSLRKKQQGSFQPSSLLNILLNRLHSFKLKAIPMSLMLGLSAVSAQSIASNLPNINAQFYTIPALTLFTNTSINNSILYSGKLSVNGTLNNIGTLTNAGGTLNNSGSLNN